MAFVDQIPDIYAAHLNTLSDFPDIFDRFRRTFLRSAKREQYCGSFRISGHSPLDQLLGRSGASLGQLSFDYFLAGTLYFDLQAHRLTSLAGIVRRHYSQPPFTAPGTYHSANHSVPAAPRGNVSFFFPSTSSNPEDVNPVVLLVRPVRNNGRIFPIRLQHPLRKFVQVVVLPGR